MGFSTNVILPDGEVSVPQHLSYGDLLAIHSIAGYNLANVVTTGPRVKVQLLGQAVLYSEATDDYIPVVIYTTNDKVNAHINGLELSLLECGQVLHLSVQHGNNVRAFKVVDVRGSVIEAKEMKVQAVIG